MQAAAAFFSPSTNTTGSSGCRATSGHGQRGEIELGFRSRWLEVFLTAPVGSLDNGEEAPSLKAISLSVECKVWDAVGGVHAPDLDVMRPNSLNSKSRDYVCR